MTDAGSEFQTDGASHLKIKLREVGASERLVEQGKGKESTSTTKRSDVDHTELPANTQHLPFLLISIR